MSVKQNTKRFLLFYIDYEACTYGVNGEQRREFLADISSFANTAGGDLLIGMTCDFRAVLLVYRLSKPCRKPRDG